MRSVLHWLAFAVAASMLGACTQEAEAPGAGREMREPSAERPAKRAAQQLAELVEQYFEEALQLNPLFATLIGDHRYDDRFANNIGSAYLERSLALEREYLDRAGMLDGSQLRGQNSLSYAIFVRNRKSNIEGFEHPTHLLPVNQFFSVPNLFAQLGSGTSLHPFETTLDYRNFLARVDDFVVWMDQAIANMRAGAELGIVQPRIVMQRVLPQLSAMLTDDVTQSVFYRPVAQMPESFDLEERESLRAAYETAIAQKTVPAYRRLHDFIRDEYLPHTRDMVGMHAMPGGREWYAYLVKTATTTDLTPDEIHQIGLDEVARIRAEMELVKEQVGFEGSLAAFFTYLKGDRRFYYDEPEQLLDAYRQLKVQVAQAAPQLFARIPKADFEIRAVEPFRAQSAAGASYQGAAPDGSRPGVLYVNTYDLGARPRYEIESIYLHEAVPGHHFQISLQRELETLPRFRRFGSYTAYVEGWGLYAERLGKDLGLYRDPYQYYGALSAEMIRAIRLVVDTGMHHKGWSREQALEYMMQNSSMAETSAVAEVERYIAAPGQALAYKIGQLQILELRTRAERALRRLFDVRMFHEQILGDGALPLDVLEAKVDRWIGTYL